MHRKALSLMELLLVLALLAGMSAISIPVLNKSFARADSLSRDAQRVAEQLRRSRQIALDRATPVCVQIGSGGNQLIVFPQRDAMAHREVIRLDGHYHFKPSGSSTTSTMQTQLLFREDGSSTGGILNLSNNIRQIHVRVERSTGQITIEAAP